MLCERADKSKEVTVVLVVSPLLALMNKQVEDLTTRGLSAVRFSNDLPSMTKESLERGQVTYIFASPESLQTKTWKQLLLSSPYQTYLTLLRSPSTIVDVQHINVYVCCIITCVHVHHPLKWIRICVALFWRNFEQNLLLFGSFRILTSLYTMTKHFCNRRYVSLYLSMKYVHGHCTRTIYSYMI